MDRGLLLDVERTGLSLLLSLSDHRGHRLDHPGVASSTESRRLASGVSRIRHCETEIAVVGMGGVDPVDGFISRSRSGRPVLLPRPFHFLEQGIGRCSLADSSRGGVLGFGVFVVDRGLGATHHACPGGVPTDGEVGAVYLSVASVECRGVCLCGDFAGVFLG